MAESLSSCAMAAVELHMISDATGETAHRLVQALEAQFPDLGYLGYKAANVPLVKGIDPPPELFGVDPAKIVGLTIDAKRLSEIRGERIRWMRGDRKYADLVEIYDELEYAAQVHRRLGCPVLEVSELSIEEISHRIIQLVERRKAAAG